MRNTDLEAQAARAEITARRSNLALGIFLLFVAVMNSDNGDVFSLITAVAGAIIGSWLIAFVAFPMGARR